MIQGGIVIEYVLDAHALIWMLEGNPKLGLRAKTILSDPTSVLVLPSIALAEACFVVAKGRTSLTSWQELIRSVRADPRVTILPLDLNFVELAMSLPADLEMHDAQIVGTVIQLMNSGKNVALLTRDQVIVNSAIIPTVW